MPSLLRSSPEALRINRRKVNIEALDLSKLVPRYRGAPYEGRAGKQKKGREPLHNPALRLPRGAAQGETRGGESSEARELTRNPAVLPAADRPLVVDKRKPKGGKKKGEARFSNSPWPSMTQT